MSVRHIPCGPFVNHSERVASEYLASRLNGASQGQRWLLLTNVASSSGAQWLADELDLVAVGPTGVHLVEVKHWDSAYLRSTPAHALEDEANKLNTKAKRLRGRIDRASEFRAPFISGKFLLTKGENSRYGDAGQRRQTAGVSFYGLPEWRELLEVEGRPLLTDEQVELICRALVPAVQPALTGDIRTFGPFFELQRVSAAGDAFHRVYRGRRRPARDPVVLHLYDLSATGERNAEDLARREFAVMQRLQKCRWLPSLMDSFQEAPAYPGELCFFSYVETEAVSLAKRSRDRSWTFAARLRFALRCLDALQELHQPEAWGIEQAILHRNLSPESIRVRSTDEPLFTQLQFARLSDAGTISGAVAPDFQGREALVAPEVRTGGLGACTVASDIYALCASLSWLFTESPDEFSLADDARKILQAGLLDDPTRRPPLATFHSQLTGLTQPAPTAEPVNSVLPVDLWDEATVQEFRGYHYRIISRLGSGGVGTTFKVMEVDPTGRTELSGPYVAKAITNEAVGASATRAYAKVRAQTGGPHLAGVLEVSTEWKPDGITALLRWIEGQPLSDWTGILSLYLEEQGESVPEAALLRWARDLCEGLSHLHRVGLVHGDVSPKNIIVDGMAVTLTDFDLSTTAGSAPLGGNPQYCAPPVDLRRSITPSDDLFALAASLFYVLFDRLPFQWPIGLEKERGLRWSDLDRSEWPLLAQFLDRATDPNPACRLNSAQDAIAFLDALTASETEPVDSPDRLAIPVLQDNEVPWLGQLLQSYPGSRKGNAETRGLDSAFARETYVATQLDERLAKDIRARQVSLVVLCGNAGDGKTAFLQNLAARLGPSPCPSAERLWNHRLPDGLRVRANLDGSAAYQGRSARELLDEFLQPFQDGRYPPDLVHLLAINDGPLLDWLEDQEKTPLTQQLRTALMREETSATEGRVRFVDLNARSLVGSLAPGQNAPCRDFLDRLLDKLLGEEQDHWAPCRNCTAQGRCHAWRSVQTLRDPQLGPRVRARLARGFQAVHHRGEVHITARGLRAALAYTFFGIHDCADLHCDPNLQPPHYWDRVFDATSEGRQGELLDELPLLDPGLDVHPQLDRHLLAHASGVGDRSCEDAASALRSLRRHAYFEWPESEIRHVGRSETALDLSGGRHLSLFQQVATGTEAERAEICAALCEGMSRMEDLPEQAFCGAGWPLKITPRTPTETAFWVSKRKDRFSLQTCALHAAPGLETLHTHVILTYRFDNGQMEKLVIGAALFNLLMEIKDGHQISDAQSDDIFANLSIFKQHLAQEGDRTLYAWNPLDKRVFEVCAELTDGIQQLRITAEGGAR